MKSFETFAKDIEALKDDLRNRVPKEIAAVMKAETEKNFRDEGYTNDGGIEKWPDRKHEKKLLYKKLQYTGAMRKSVRPVSVSGKRVSKAKLVSSNKLAKLHNEGGMTDGSPFVRTSPRYATRHINDKNIKRVPPRPFMGIGDNTVKKALDLVNGALNRQLGE